MMLRLNRISNVNNITVIPSQIPLPLHVNPV